MKNLGKKAKGKARQSVGIDRNYAVRQGKVRVIQRMQLLFAIFMLVLVAFVIGVYVGVSVGTSYENKVDLLMRENKLSQESFLLEQDMFSSLNIPCEYGYDRLNSLSKELYKIGKMLEPEDAEERLGKDNYYYLKVRFHLLQLRNYLFMYNLRQKCSDLPITILFFFKRYQNESYEQGRILDRVVGAYNVSVFAVEFNYTSATKFIEDYYNISMAPSIVIDYNFVFSGVVPFDGIAKTIEEIKSARQG